MASDQKALQQDMVDRWNARHPVGTEVVYWNIPSEQHAPMRSRTRTPASVLSGHTAVVWLEGEPGCWALSHMAPVCLPCNSYAPDSKGE